MDGGTQLIEVVDKLEKLLALKTDWLHLETSSAVRVFQSWAWVNQVVRSQFKGDCSGVLWILKWTSEFDDNVVIFPWWIDRRGNVRFLADDFSDQLGVLSSSSSESVLLWACKEAVQVIVENPRVRTVWLQKLDVGSAVSRYLTVFLKGSIVFRDHVRGRLRTSQTEDFIAGQHHLKQKDRSRLRAIEHRTKDVGFVIVSGGQFPGDRIKRARDRMVASGLRSSCWLSNDVLAVAESAWASGYCELAVLGDDQALGLRLVKDGQSDAWICLYEHPQLVSELYVRYFQEKARTGDWVFDLGVGEYEYKWKTFRPEPQLSFTLRWSKSRFGTIWNLVRMLVRSWRIACQ